jgi:hypothetical protein
VPSPPNGASAPQARLASLNGASWEVMGACYACRVSPKKTLSLEAQARDVKAQYSFDFETSKTNLNIIFFNKGMNL